MKNTNLTEEINEKLTLVRESLEAVGFIASTFKNLADEYKRYSINLRPKLLHYLVGGDMISRVWIECEIMPFPDPDIEKIVKNFIDVHFPNMSLKPFTDSNSYLGHFKKYSDDLEIEVMAFYLNPYNETERIGGNFAIT